MPIQTTANMNGQPDSRATAGERTIFIIRCAAVAALAYQFAAQIGLEHPIWAPMSALIVSQGTAAATRSSIVGRCLGTIAGAAIALVVSWTCSSVNLAFTVQMAMAVALCAMIAARWPLLRVCLWTCPLILGSGIGDRAAAVAATSRVVEVILGSVLGGLAAAIAEYVQECLSRRAAARRRAVR